MITRQVARTKNVRRIYLVVVTDEPGKVSGLGTNWHRGC